VGNGLLARLPRGRVPQVGRSDGWPPKLLRELDRIPPTGRLTVTHIASASFPATWRNGTKGRVFVKQLRRPRSFQARTRFRREVAADETLKHAGLPNLIDDNSTQSEDLAVTLYLVLEGNEGDTLTKRISEDGSLLLRLAIACKLGMPIDRQEIFSSKALSPSGNGEDPATRAHLQIGPRLRDRDRTGDHRRICAPRRLNADTGGASRSCEAARS
jgi:hypothetical protein